MSIFKLSTQNQNIQELLEIDPNGEEKEKEILLKYPFLASLNSKLKKRSVLITINKINGCDIYKLDDLKHEKLGFGQILANFLKERGTNINIKEDESEKSLLELAKKYGLGIRIFNLEKFIATGEFEKKIEGTDTGIINLLQIYDKQYQKFDKVARILSYHEGKTVFSFSLSGVILNHAASLLEVIYSKEKEKEKLCGIIADYLENLDVIVVNAGKNKTTMKGQEKIKYIKNIRKNKISENEIRRYVINAISDYYSKNINIFIPDANFIIHSQFQESNINIVWIKDNGGYRVYSKMICEVELTSESEEYFLINITRMDGPGNSFIRCIKKVLHLEDAKDNDNFDDAEFCCEKFKISIEILKVETENQKFSKIITGNFERKITLLQIKDQFHIVEKMEKIIKIEKKGKNKNDC